MSTPTLSLSESFAGTILKYLPPGVVDPTRTANYVADFYDDTHGFGHSTILSVQKSSKTALPVSVYFGVKGYLGGFSAEYFGVKDLDRLPYFTS